jgi:hypothetical protein
MEVCPRDIQRRHHRCGDGEPRLVLPPIELRFDGESTASGRRANQLHYRLEGIEESPSPVHRDVGEEPVLDLVPLARPRREVNDAYRQPRFGREALQLRLPDAGTVAVAASTVGRHQQLGCLGIRRSPHGLPPGAKRAHGEGRRVVVGSDRDEGVVPAEVVDAVGDRLAEGQVREVVHVGDVGHLAGLPLEAAFWNAPTSSFFFASTETTGWPFAWNACTSALMCRNCASRSGWSPPSSVLRVAWRL